MICDYSVHKSLTLPHYHHRYNQSFQRNNYQNTIRRKISCELKWKEWNSSLSAKVNILKRSISASSIKRDTFEESGIVCCATLWVDTSFCWCKLIRAFFFIFFFFHLLSLFLALFLFPSFSFFILVLLVFLLSMTSIWEVFVIIFSFSSPLSVSFPYQPINSTRLRFVPYFSTKMYFSNVTLYCKNDRYLLEKWKF